MLPLLLIEEPKALRGYSSLDQRFWAPVEKLECFCPELSFLSIGSCFLIGSRGSVFWFSELSVLNIQGSPPLRPPPPNNMLPSSHLNTDCLFSELSLRSPKLVLFLSCRQWNSKNGSDQRFSNNGQSFLDQAGKLQISALWPQHSLHVCILWTLKKIYWRSEFTRIQWYCR